MTFYPAFGPRRSATNEDIVQGRTFDNFREAKLFVSRYGHDSDDAVFTNIDGRWIRVWKQDCHGNLLVTDELGAWCEAVPLHEYLQR